MLEEYMTAARWQAGRAFLDALEAQGILPDSALWLLDRDGERWELALVTPLVDEVGTTEIYTTLFAAQEGGLLPASPSIWDVSVHSPDAIRELDLDGGGERDVAIGRLLARPSWTYGARPAGAVDETAWLAFRRRAESTAEEGVASG